MPVKRTRLSVEETIAFKRSVVDFMERTKTSATRLSLAAGFDNSTWRSSTSSKDRVLVATAKKFTEAMERRPEGWPSPFFKGYGIKDAIEKKQVERTLAEKAALEARRGEGERRRLAELQQWLDDQERPKEVYSYLTKIPTIEGMAL